MYTMYKTVNFVHCAAKANSKDTGSLIRSGMTARGNTEYVELRYLMLLGEAAWKKVP